MTRLKLLTVLLIAVAANAADDLATVVAKPVSRTVELPGEILPYLSVAVHAKVAGFVDRVLVDRGSPVSRGELLVELRSPELTARVLEAEAKVQSAESDRVQTEAQLAAARATADRLKDAAKTPGAIAGNEIVQAEKQVDAAQALVRSREQAKHAAESVVQAQRDLLEYLKITAPFDGVVTDRLVHPGALVGPGADPVLLVIQQISRLRCVVAVPEEDLSGIATGATVSFHVPAFPERTYSGTVARIAHSVDQKTRTMAVELDVINRDGSLAPGMYPTAKWPIRRSHPALFVPKTSVVTTTERTFVIREHDGKAQWVDVRKGAADDDLVEVSGNLQAGDRVVRRASDEIRDGATLKAQPR
jgi:membrane fusion protein (multidrug efflux system)